MTMDHRELLLELARAVDPRQTVSVPAGWLLELLPPNGGPPAPVATTGTPEESLLTVQEVAERFGVTPDWLYRHWKVVGGVKLGRKVLRFPAGALPRYLATRRKTP